MTDRLWVGNDGKYEVYASYVCLFQDKKVKLRKPSGALIAVPLHMLCDADIAYIATQSKLPTVEDSNSPIPAPRTIIERSASNESFTFEPLPSIVQHMSSDDLIPKQSLSTITDQVKPHNKRLLTTLPSQVLTRITAYLDVHSRLVFSTVTKRCRQIVLQRPDVWRTLFFSSGHYIDDAFMYKLVVYLHRDELHKAINHVLLDRTAITAKTVVLILKNLEALVSLSLKSCWHVMSYDLAVSLTNLQGITSSITQVTLGKVLHRGTITPSSINSKSFGQDVWHINTALNKLVHRSVYVDIALCDTCQLGAASHEFYCSCCGFLPLRKCITCAPKCDR